MCTYLAPRGSTYYFRRIIPAELRAALDGRREFTFSLRTKDRETAKRLVPGHTIRTQALLDRAAASIAAERPTDALRASDSPLAPSSPQTEQAAFEAEEAAAAKARYDARADARRALRRKLHYAHSGDLPVELQAARDLLREMKQADLAEAIPPAISPPVAPSTRLDTVIVDLWAAERQPAKKTIDTHRAVARWFYERVGQKPVASITRQDVLAFKAKLVEEGTTPANTKMKLSRLRTLLQWAADNDHAPSNVAQGITVKDTAQARNRRVEFDLASLNRIFAGPVHASESRPVGGRGEAAYWLPLLALFTGARLEELGQLRVADVQELSYPDSEGADARAWFIHVREDKQDALTLKNAASERDIPVHPELERLGFLRFVTSARVAGQTRLFPMLRPNIYGQLTAKWGEWFGAYLRRECAVADRRMVFHSFRHTFKQYARHVGIDEGIQRQLMGHSSSDVADAYGSGHPLHRVVEGMGQYRVPGLVLSGRS